MKNISIDDRLKSIALLVDKCDSIADIGTDHGYLPIYIINNNIAKYAYACDVAVGPLNSAKENIAKYQLEDKITIINDDALNTEINGLFELIFIDASKGNNINFFNKYSKNLAPNGVIITDNLSFHGLVENNDLIKTKNQAGIVKKIKAFITFLEENEKTNYGSNGSCVCNCCSSCLV